MAVVIETTVGDLTVDLFLNERPRTCMNFLKLCKMKYYNFNLIFSIERDFIAQTGDPTGTGKGGASVYHMIHGGKVEYYEGEKIPIIKHSTIGLISMASCGSDMYGSQFFLTLGNNLDSLDEEHLVFGHVVEGLEVLETFNQTLIDDTKRPYQDILITHTVVLSDPFPDPEELRIPCNSPLPPPHLFNSNYIAADEDLKRDDLKSLIELQEEMEEKEAEARATILEMVGDLPSAHMAPPENVLFVCKLNPVTTSEDLQVIFSRFGKIVSAEVICDHVSGNSLQYAFIEFAIRKSCEDAYFKMDNVLIDDRRIHVDFSQSVSKIKWKGKGMGVEYFDDQGKKVDKENRQNRHGDKDGSFSKQRTYSGPSHSGKDGRSYGGSFQADRGGRSFDRQPNVGRDRSFGRPSHVDRDGRSYDRPPYVDRDGRRLHVDNSKERDPLYQKRFEDKMSSNKPPRRNRSQETDSSDSESEDEDKDDLQRKSKKERRKILKKLKKELKKSKKDKKSSKKKKSKSKKKKKKESSSSSSESSDTDSSD